MEENKGSSSKTDRKTTIEDFGLVRKPGHFHPSAATFAERYFDPGAGDWKTYYVTDDDDDAARAESRRWPLLHTYAVSASQRAYVMSHAELTAGAEMGAPRLTQMRGREMIVANLRAEGGDGLLKSVRWLGGNLIVNEYASKAIERVFQRAAAAGIRGGGGVLEVTLDSDPLTFAACSEGNPFVSGAASLLRHHAEELGGAFVKRLIFVSAGDSLHPDYPRFSMIVELGRPSTTSSPLMPS